MTSISSINSASAFMGACKTEELSSSTKQKLEALGIDPATVTSEAQAQSLIGSKRSCLKSRCNSIIE